MKYIDLTQSFVNNMPVFPGNPPSELTLANTFAKDGYNVSKVNTGMHVGSHMDAPNHMLQEGRKLIDYPIETFFGRGVLIDARGIKQIDAKVLDGVDIQKGDIVLVLTGFSDHLHQPDYYTNYPVITNDFAIRLTELGVKILGLDTPSPDNAPYEVHKILFKKGILILESLTNFESLLNINSFDVVALPVKFDAEAALVRVVAQIHD